MFFKCATLLAFAASAIAQIQFPKTIQPGLYRISNVASQSTARSFKVSSPVFVSSSGENPGLFEVWDVGRNVVSGDYTIKNIGLNSYASVPASSGEAVRTSKSIFQASFMIEHASNNEFVIKIPMREFYWTVEQPVTPSAEIKIRYGGGGPRERWIFDRVDRVNE